MAKRQTKKKTTAVTRKGKASPPAEVAPEVQAMLDAAKEQEQAEARDLQQDVGMARINVQNADDEMDVVILAQTRTHAYWKNPFRKGGEGTPPDCFSDNGVIGQGVRVINGKEVEGPQECATCQLNQFGSAGDDSRAKACKNMRLLAVQRVDSEVLSPEIVSIPPTGLKACAKYLKDLIQEGIPRVSVVTHIERVEDEDNPMGTFKFTRGDRVSPEQLAKLAPIFQFYSKQKALASRQDLGHSADAGEDAVSQLNY